MGSNLSDLGLVAFSNYREMLRGNATGINYQAISQILFLVFLDNAGKKSTSPLAPPTVIYSLEASREPSKSIICQEAR